ncbi:pleckstrin homology domain-containing family G member 3-like [Hippocampus zosterae]|uniref:pleckstrin homology domain-containing family G member 3-like n=1 Tax=Hippocampus zosterae TaxID=109293 RepID=UPI00223D00AA|nr:pleckstrin homology domain-containing family G member 3-like [Hippocampus zosterae]
MQEESDWKGRSQRTPRQLAAIMAPTYLDRVVSEIIETERMYVRDLRMIVEDYLAHIIDQADLSIRPEQVCFLFGNIEDIYEFNSELLQDLDLCRRDAVEVARCFVLKSAYFDIYTQYCTNYPNSVAALTDCMQDKSLAVFFRERQSALQRPLPLGTYLLKPVQRILKYHLLLQEIAKHFDPEEEGYEVVEEAIVTMTGVAWYINDMKRKHEHAVRLQEVQSLLLNWKGPDLTTYGELVLEGTFKVRRAKTERTLFLLERVLLISKRRGQHYVYKSHISCSALMLIESTKDSLSFSVTHYKQPKQPHTMQAKSVEEKKTWAQHIKRIILENHHDIIPQKAKDTLLSSRYPHRHRYGPDRLKKVPSRSADDVPRPEDVNEDTELKCQGQVGVASKETERSGDSKDQGGLGEEEEEEAGAVGACEQMSTEEAALASLLATEPGASEEPRPALRPADPPSGASESRSKPGSSGESSEDEDGEKEADGNGSILPPSVLDKAGAIAQHFGSVKRGAVAPDDARSPGLSPRLLGFGDRHAGPSSPLRGADAERALWSPRGDARFDEETGTLQRRDSILSGRDQLLIGKIKTYYETAENRDASFGLRRRESLTYIPAGLVKTSISRLNSIPDRAESRPATEESGSPPLDSKGGSSRSGAPRQQSAEDEEFRPSGEMLKVWRLMEQRLGETCRLSDVARGAKPRAEPNTVSEETRPASPVGQTPGDAVRAATPAVPAPVRRDRLRTADEDANLPDEQADSRVRHLARQYSRRIKSGKALGGQRSCANPTGEKTLACVLEESPHDGAGPTPDQVPAQRPDPVFPPARIGSDCPVGVPRCAQSFDWPNVRALRSKYAERSAADAAEQMFDVRWRRRSLSEASPGRAYATPTPGRPKSRKGLRRAHTLDPRLSLAAMRESRERRRADGGGDRAAAAQTPPETLPRRRPSLTGEPLREPEPAETLDVDRDAYVEIRSPTSREKISILAVIDRCRAYQESDEYKQRSQSAESRDGSRSVSSSGDRVRGAGDRSESSTSEQRNSVKNLREKFQKLNS